MQMVESRRADRIRSFLRAKILFNNQNSSFDCIVRNISARQGRRSRPATQISVPSQFDLEIPQKGRTYRAKIVWRDAEAIGVEFVQKLIHQATTAADPSESKVERLERENRRLRSAVVRSDQAARRPRPGSRPHIL